MRQRPLQLLSRHHLKAFASRIDQEALEALHTSSGQRFYVLGVVARNPTPGRPVDKALFHRSFALRFKCRNRGCLGQAVQRHIDQRRKSASRSSTRCRPEALPLRASRFIDVNMAVHKARQNGQVSEIMQRVSGRHFTRLTESPIRPSSSRTAAARTPSGVTTRVATKACAILSMIPPHNIKSKPKAPSEGHADANSSQPRLHGAGDSAGH